MRGETYQGDILSICDEIDEAAGKATPRPWHTGGDFFDRNGRIRKWLWGSRAKPDHSSGPCVVGESDLKEADADYIALTANHATKLTAAVRKLVEYAQIVERLSNEKMSGVRWQLHIRLDQIRAQLRHDYPGLLDAAKPAPVAGEGGSDATSA